MDLGWLIVGIILLIVAAVVHREGGFPYARAVALVCVGLAVICFLFLVLGAVGEDEGVGDGDLEDSFLFPVIALWGLKQRYLRRITRTVS